MIIRIEPALPGDENAIFTLVKKVHLKNVSPKAGKSGFIMYPKSPEKFLSRINLCKYFFVAKKDKNLLGYLLANTLQELKLLGEDISNLENLEDFVVNEEFIYLDHLVVDPKFTSKGIGQKLLDHLMSQIKGVRAVGYIVYQPVLNERSINFFVHKNNWRLIKKVQFDASLCGLYGSPNKN